MTMFAQSICRVKMFITWSVFTQMLFLNLIQHQGESFKSKLAMFNNKSGKEHPADPFHAEDPFKSFSGLYKFFSLFCCPCCLSSP